MVFHSEYADVPLVDQPIHEAVLARSTAEHGDRTALIDAVDGTSLSYAQLDAFTRRLAAGLADAGVRKGDVLALHSPNSLAYPAVFYAASMAGAAVTPVHPLCTADEFARQLQDSGARWIVTVAGLLDTARTAAERTGGVSEIFVCDEAEGHRSVRDLRQSTAPEPHVVVDPAEDVAALPYSSGTTALPKGVMLTHRNIATNLAQLQPLVPSGPGDRVLAVLPFFHIYGLTALMNAPLRAGATVIVLPRFELEQFLAAVEKHHVNALYVAPPIVLALAKHPAVDAYDLSSVEYLVSAAAPLDAELSGLCARRLGLPTVMQAYGMTELSPGTHVVPRAAHDAPLGTVGKLLPGTEMRIVALDGTDGGMGTGAGTGVRADLGAGEEGEIWIRGPQVMKGYLGLTGETDALIDADGWLHTGDIGWVDADGWLYVVDRVKELIKYKGYQVAPADLEAVLLSHPGIADAAVIGVADGDGNEVPKAFVVPRRDVAVTADEVLAYVAGRVAAYKKVRQVEFVGVVPRAASGKILRRQLREKDEKGRRT
ncbi:4-coumarate--CoA ligase family protein [Streptomyces armeniacus]|uniref:4-coumarate--CoA ligase family protein n=1 Tax=Streptomyces armeniacus TaxID=83291 RepID=A0A345XKV9_9ACTN|nr:4-coumarate--CoA ligase family protein [Streptomyces armeniacus]AXK32275.1 4-coumarate--CoA ligase family protein [Streptomyces armeniacus]